MWWVGSSQSLSPWKMWKPTEVSRMALTTVLKCSSGTILKCNEIWSKMLHALIQSLVRLKKTSKAHFGKQRDLRSSYSLQTLTGTTMEFYTRRGSKGLMYKIQVEKKNASHPRCVFYGLCTVLQPWSALNSATGLHVGNTFSEISGRFWLIVVIKNSVYM